MPITALLFVSLFAQSTDKVVYRDTKLGLQFEYPKTWKVRRDRYSAIFEIPLGSAQTATVQLYNAKFKGTVDDWQLVQAEINRSMKRTVDRQWQEDLLGVPLLMTRISYEEGNRPTFAMVGLLYSSFEEKMHFRLSSSAETAEAAESQWREALLTLRTITGELPGVENPNLPSVKPEPEKPTTVLKPKEEKKTFVRGTEPATLTVDGTSFRLLLGKGWSLADGKLVHPNLKGEILVQAKIGLPEEAGNALLTVAKEALGDFDSVRLREDPKPMEAPSGGLIGRVFRTGMAKGTTIVRGTIVGYCEGVYWIAQYRSSDADAYRKDRALMDDLFRVLYAEKA